MKIMEQLKAKCIELYFKTSPRYQSLGQIERRIYFIDCYKGVIHCLTYSEYNHQESLQTVIHL